MSLFYLKYYYYYYYQRFHFDPSIPKLRKKHFSKNILKCNVIAIKNYKYTTLGVNFVVKLLNQFVKFCLKDVIPKIQINYEKYKKKKKKPYIPCNNNVEV